MVEHFHGKEGVTSSSLVPGLAGDRHAILEAIEGRQAELLDDALDLGARLYAEKPKAFVGRVGAYWEAWPPG